nr:hypothetical protein [Ardenticatena sp.]
MPQTVRRRRSIRLKGWDYCTSAVCFVTICTHDRAPLVGRVVDGDIVLNAFGEIARAEWFRSAEIRAEIELFPDEFVVMPNHIHGIVWIVETDDGTGHRDDAVGVHGRSPNVGMHGRSPNVGMHGRSSNVGGAWPVAQCRGCMAGRPM